MKLSARNQMPATVTEVNKGATTTVVKVDVPSPARPEPHPHVDSPAMFCRI
jgi:hypothetical protein